MCVIVCACVCVKKDCCCVSFYRMERGLLVANLCGHCGVYDLHKTAVILIVVTETPDLLALDVTCWSPSRLIGTFYFGPFYIRSFYFGHFLFGPFYIFFFILGLF